jgi:hypothetical protein
MLIAVRNELLVFQLSNVWLKYAKYGRALMFLTRAKCLRMSISIKLDSLIEITSWWFQMFYMFPYESILPNHSVENIRIVLDLII